MSATRVKRDEGRRQSADKSRDEYWEEERLDVHFAVARAEPCVRRGGDGSCPDPANGCACPQGTSCRQDVSATFTGSSCCPEGMVPCNGVCVLDTPENRRACRDCREGDANYCGGSCCDTGRSCCDGRCTDTAADPQNCGACGAACEAGRSCCGGVCADLSADDRNCGSCGNACQSLGAESFTREGEREPYRGRVVFRACRGGQCDEVKSVECEGATPVPCWSSCGSGGPCCMATEAACRDWEGLR